MLLQAYTSKIEMLKEYPDETIFSDIMRISPKRVFKIERFCQDHNLDFYKLFLFIVDNLKREFKSHLFYYAHTSFLTQGTALPAFYAIRLL